MKTFRTKISISSSVAFQWSDSILRNVHTHDSFRMVFTGTELMYVYLKVWCTNTSDITETFIIFDYEIVDLMEL